MIELVPIDLATARRFVAAHHRHSTPPRGWKWGVGAMVDGRLVGVAVASRPVARALARDGRTLEVTRTCTTGERNVNSRLYGAMARAARALGYLRLVTYTTIDEPGSSLLAVGFRRDGNPRRRPAAEEWANREGRYVSNLFGETRTPKAPRQRWVLDL